MKLQVQPHLPCHVRTRKCRAWHSCRSPHHTCNHPCNHHRHVAFRPEVVVAANRHPELLSPSSAHGDTPRLDIEAHPAYNRVDYSHALAHKSRWSYAACLQGGEPRMRLAEASLWASAQDDALASCTVVPFPVASYQARFTSITQHVKAQLLSQGLLRNPSAPPPDPQQVLRVVEAALFTKPWPRKGVVPSSQAPIASLGFKAPEHGRSALPNRVQVDHPGTWEVASDAYMHEALIRKVAHPAALAIIYAKVMSELLLDGSVDFAVSMDTSGYDDVPSGVLLPGITHDMVKPRSPGAPHHMLNTCSSDVLAELQRHLKRTYWCWAWDGAVDAYQDGGNNSLGGFRAAAKAALGEEMSAAIQAISTVAAWRLDRGIFTSPGAGDIRRARAAAERLVLLRGDEQPDERRDLAVLLVHAGELGKAKAELRAYMSTQHYRTTGAPFDKVLCQRLMDLLASAGEAVKEPKQVLSVSSVLAEPEPVDEQTKRPLTW